MAFQAALSTRDQRRAVVRSPMCCIYTPAKVFRTAERKEMPCSIIPIHVRRTHMSPVRRTYSL
jgi:hypothetical protein